MYDLNVLSFVVLNFVIFFYHREALKPLQSVETGVIRFPRLDLKSGFSNCYGSPVIIIIG